jgi:tellurite resistance protein TerC
MFLGKPLWIWFMFLGIIIFFLALDLGVFHRKNQVLSIKNSLMMSGFYILLGLTYGLFVYFEMGSQAAEEYYTGYVLEKSLSVDNIFVISLIFSGFAVPREYQYRVLFYGILGVIILRGLMIGGGSILIHNFEWILYVFGAFLVFTGVKLLFSKEKIIELDESRFLKFVQKHLRVTEKFEGNRFLVRRNGAIWATPLLVALLMIEFIDLIFAIDSIPAIFAITRDPYIVYTSNIFAVLGLRALYFALADMIHRFHYLKYALALILIFIGSKIFLVDFFGWEKFPAMVSLGVTLGLLGFGVGYSLLKTK